MKTANKVFLIVIACLLILGALSLAGGIMLGLTHVGINLFSGAV